jgi:hypothetical protein
MNIGQFAQKPQLIKVEIDNPDVVEAYDGVVSFWITDSVDINTYFDFFRTQSEQDGDKLNAIMRKLIKNEQGEQAIPDDHVLPIDLALASLTAINERLGKSRTKSSTQETGKQQD